VKKANYKGNPDGKPIYPNSMDHGYDKPISGGTDVIKNLRETYLKEQGNTHFVAKSGSRDYFDYQEKAQTFKVGDEVFFLANQFDIGRVTAVFPAIGTVDVQWTAGLQSSVPVEDLRRKDKDKLDASPPPLVDTPENIEKKAAPGFEIILSDMEAKFPMVPDMMRDRFNIRMHNTRARGFRLYSIDRTGMTFEFAEGEAVYTLPYRHAEVFFEAFWAFALEGNLPELKKALIRYAKKGEAIAPELLKTANVTHAPIRHIMATFPKVSKSQLEALNLLLRGHGLQARYANGTWQFSETISSMGKQAKVAKWQFKGAKAISALNALRKGIPWFVSTLRSI
jgi:hypothetical protein